tara:strand:+ start:766 stop:1113 length:348 start_codon:yes stop_codon:yes gene_type:complete
MTSSHITERPWGTYQTVIDEPTYKVKKIIVNPNQRFSLQYHQHRWEDWIIVDGSGIVNDGKVERNCIVGDRFHIPPLTIHRATGGPDGLTFIEVQRGICEESDIVRIEDDYGRIV